MVTIYSPVEEQYVKGKCQFGHMPGIVQKKIYFSKWLDLEFPLLNDVVWKHFVTWPHQLVPALPIASKARITGHLVSARQAGKAWMDGFCLGRGGCMSGQHRDLEKDLSNWLEQLWPSLLVYPFRLIVGSWQGWSQMAIMWLGCCIHPKCKLVAKRPDRNYLAMGVLDGPELQEPVVSLLCPLTIAEWMVCVDYLYSFAIEEAYQFA